MEAIFTASRKPTQSFHDANLSAGLKIPLNRHMSVTPKIQYSFPLNTTASHRLKSLSFNGDHDQFIYGGIVFDFNIP